MNIVQPMVARGLLRTLSGFRGYPRGEGENRFIDVLCEISLSVEHAASTLMCFDSEFPTIREMRDAALNLRPKFEIKVNQQQAWEKQYGKPDPAWSRRFMDGATGDIPTVDPKERKRQHVEEKRVMLWQAIRDSMYYTEGPGARRPDGFWHDAAQKHKRNHPEEVAAFRLQLQDSGWDTLMAVDWAKAKPAVAAVQPSPRHQITQSDIDIELQKSGRESGDGE